nr:hypothetical protein CFP56_55483 [Quercus suber]
MKRIVLKSIVAAMIVEAVQSIVHVAEVAEVAVALLIMEERGWLMRKEDMDEMVSRRIKGEKQGQSSQTTVMTVLGGHINSPLMHNGLAGVNSMIETKIPQSYPANPDMEVELKSPNDVQTAPRNIEEDIDEMLRKEKICDSAVDLISDSTSRDQLKHTKQQLITSRVGQGLHRLLRKHAALRPGHGKTNHIAQLYQVQGRIFRARKE